MFWDPLFDRISELSGAGADQCKLIAALIISFPLASIYVRIPANRPNVAHWFSIITSTIFLWPLLGLGQGLLELLFMSVVTYLIVASVRGPNMPWIAFFFVMTCMTITHVRRAFGHISVERIEISGSQMVLVMKLSTFAWNVNDGRRKIETLDESQKATRLAKLPNPLAFLGYCFFFPSVLVGPSFEYVSYEKLLNKTIYDVTPPPGTPAATDKSKRRTPKGRRRVAVLHFTLGVVFLAYYAVMGDRGSYQRVIGPDWPTWSLLTRFGFVQFCAFCVRTKYYAVWSLSEGACILTGIGFNGYGPRTGRTRWNRVRNIDIAGIEGAESFKQLFDSWNCRTNVWLRDCVYKRLVKPGKKPGAAQSMATFVTSAFWHGIAPGYYLAFVTAGMVQYVGKQFRHLVRPYFLAPTDPAAALKLPKWHSQPLAKRMYDIVGWFLVQINLNYLVAPFLLLELKPSIMAWHRMYWYTHVQIALFLTVMRFGTRRWLRSGLKPREKKVPEMPIPELKLSPPTPDEFRRPEGDEDGPDNDVEWVKYDLNTHALEDGEAIDMDGGLMDEVLTNLETRPSTPHANKDE
ncbi:hypothetical protein CcaverHIS002_0608830 [Cutaneotrichosporon cavernicola]|nr:hypothetical protein CcaverHIS002_0608830 [Cutaneotrichosporon cavernicola]BEJ02147.1 hypothetical protein CcaverHIS631_0608290 [Cutaneotrichosporon cavernicola]BEJ09908.1 hypothetical protein CcaverHIS641_0608230 [Cutaneotrichosporon cavernicola]